ncbi:hypothetical protein [Streptomyces sp. 5-6(2022)]|uniref:hypothetical protein n=1 Tax=Streptomyces sp. 5-6(2022) TaxID=2936510 RepID=UPI0023B9B7A7|nr:hypothetical protein [Streptomyces sp. 5-6(2022)]
MTTIPDRGPAALVLGAYWMPRGLSDPADNVHPTPAVPVHTVLPDQTRQDIVILLDGAMLLRTFANPAAMAAQMAHLQRLRESAALLDTARRRFEQLAKDRNPIRFRKS